LFRLLAVIVIAGVGTSAVVAGIFPRLVDIATAHESTSSLPELDPLAQRSVMYDRNGNVIAVFKAEENRKPVSIKDMSQDAIDAVLAVEDAGYYRHKGVNGSSLIRAILTNISAGEVVQGGSTITQQVVKLALVGSKRDANRKIREAMYALRLERQFTKDQILERYLNTVYFGNGAYGLEAASEVYFGKKASQINIAEGAFLAGLIRNPEGYDPFRHPDRSTARRRQSLDRLVAIGRLTKVEADAINVSPIPDRPLSTTETPKPGTYFVEQAKNVLLASASLGGNAQERYNALFRGGLQIYTTFDPAMQTAAEQARDGQLTGVDPKFTAAITSLEPKTGAVRALVGGPGFQRYNFDLATQGLRQPGSTFKVFVLVAALEAGVRPDDLLDGTSPCTFPVKGQKPYVVAGTSGGIAPVALQLQRSINCAFVRLGLIVGVDRVLDVAKRMGVDTSAMLAVPSASIGTFEVSPLQMASAFGVLADRGVRHNPYFIERIVDRDGNELFNHAQEPGQQVIDPGVADTAVELMRGVITGGTGTRAALKDRPAAGKTGTTEDNADAWFVGFTPDLVSAVWMGAPTGRVPMLNIGPFATVTGGSFPALMWHDFMTAVLTGSPVGEFPAAPPPNPDRGPRQLFLPGTDCVAKPVDTSIVDPNGSVLPATSFEEVNVVTTLVPGGPKSLPLVPADYVLYPCQGGPPEPSTTAPPSTVPTTTTSTIPATTTTVAAATTTVAATTSSSSNA
jgi:membrane peptidoglycan carboxypeptidase